MLGKIPTQEDCAPRQPKFTPTTTAKAVARNLARKQRI